MELSTWLLVSVILPSVLFEQTNGDFPSGANKAVRCMLALHSPEDYASLPKVIVPSHLLQEYNDAPSSLHEALQKKSLEQLTEDQISNIPLSLLYLIPRTRLVDLKTHQMSAILLKHADDTSLVHQIATSLHHENKIYKLFEKMNISLPEEAQQVFAESLEITDLTKSFLDLRFIEREPLVAYLRPSVLFNVSTSTLFTLLNVLHMSAPKQPKKSAYHFLTEAAIRREVALSKVDGFVLGLTSDELLDESLSFDISVSDFKLDLSILQARALFERNYQSTALSRSNFIDSKPLLYKLSPDMLQKFPQNVHKYDAIEPTVSIPLPTACQITEYVKADCIQTSKLPKDEDEFWDFHIRHLGKWVYTLPLSALEGYKTSTLNKAVLKTIESPAISPMQAYILTGKGETLDVMTPSTIMIMEAFLDALPASQLVNRKLGDISLHVKLHLISKLPANNLPRTLSLVNRIASSIGDSASDDNAGDTSVLEELLTNNDVNQIMSLLSPKDLALSADAILNFLSENRIRNAFKQTIQQLPQQILAALLDHDRANNPSHWRWSWLLDGTRLSHLFIGGLTCQHVEEMDTGLFVPIMHQYNSIRKRPFPKNLQSCCLQKLINQLKLKMTLTQAGTDFGLISLLEPVEIDAIGGYVLVNIPLDAMKVSPYLGHILSKIGRLSSAELMLSADISRLKQIAELAVDKNGDVNTFLVRNLVWFLPANTSTPDLRLVLEAELLDTTLCLPTEDRQQLATRLLSLLGPPEQWSAGVLATLQDLLIVFSEEELGRVPQSSWTKAADSLISHYSDSVSWIQLSTFYKVCAEMLGKSEGNYYKKAIGRYTRWRLKAAQWLLDTVVPVSQPEASNPSPTLSHEYSEQDKDSKPTISVFAPEIEIETSDEDENSEDHEESSSVRSTTSTEKTTTKESKTEESTIKESTTQNSTTTESITITVRSTTSTEKTTTKESTTEESTIKESTTQDSTTTERITEDSESQDSTTKESIRNEEGTTKETNTYENLPEIESSSKKSPAHEILPVHDVTLNTTKESTSTKEVYSESVVNATTETSTTGKVDEIKASNLSSTTQGTVTLKANAVSIDNNYAVKEDNFAVNSSEKSYANMKKIENVPPCINSVDKEDCQNETIAGPKESKVPVNASESSREDVTTKIYPETAPAVSNKTSNLFSENQSNNSSFQSTPIPQIKTYLNQSQGPPSMNISQTKIIQLSTNKINRDESSKMPSSSVKPYSKVTPIDGFGNGTVFSSSTERIQSLKKNTTIQENIETSYTHDKESKTTLSIFKPQTDTGTSDDDEQDTKDHDESSSADHKLSKQGFSDDEDLVEEEILNYDNDDEILKPVFRRKRRGIFFESNSFTFSCNAVKMVGSLSELALTPSDLNEMSTNDIANCRVEFGSMELSEQIQKTIWRTLDSSMKSDGVHLLGRLLRVLSVADLWDIKFRASDPWILETINAIIKYNNNTMVMKKLMQEVAKHNAEFSVDLLTVLGPAVCSLEPASLRALSVIGLDLGPHCPSCLPYLSKRATEELGGVNLWTPHFVHSLQTVVAGLDLDNWKQLASSYHKPLAGLQPSAAKCLNTSHLEVLSPGQISMIPAETLYSLSEHQLAALNSTQLEAVRNITHQSITEKMTPTKRVHAAGLPTGNSYRLFPSLLIITFIVILNYCISL